MKSLLLLLKTSFFFLSMSAQGAEIPVVSLPPTLGRILQNRCATCHDDVSDQRGRLDLAHWEKLKNGEVGFPHEDRQGNQLPLRTTLRQILYRITTDDPEERMPLGDQLDAADTAVVADWVQSQQN